ncbi:hypothetical protein HMSSN036_67830 [Paenibacillus macerans]|nr:hypothetical protein HMSSN036_67830 [Paenibacillus macerans]
MPYAEDWLKHLIVPLLSDPGAAAALDRGDHATDVSNMNVNKQALDHIVQFSQNAEIPADWLLPIQRWLRARWPKATARMPLPGFMRRFEVKTVEKSASKGPDAPPARAFMFDREVRFLALVRRFDESVFAETRRSFICSICRPSPSFTVSNALICLSTWSIFS